MPNKQFDEISKTIHDLFMNVQEMELIKEFEIGNTKYGFVPDIENISYGEYLDLVELSKNTWNNIPQIMSILYRPITATHFSGRYDIAPYSGTNDLVAELFNEKLTMDIVFGAISFFLNGPLVFLRDIQTSTMETLTVLSKTNTHLKQALQKNGVSIEHLLPYVEETLSILTEPQK